MQHQFCPHQKVQECKSRGESPGAHKDMRETKTCAPGVQARTHKLKKSRGGSPGAKQGFRERATVCSYTSIVWYEIAYETMKSSDQDLKMNITKNILKINARKMTFVFIN